jgi:hypothetical protein
MRPPPERDRPLDGKINDAIQNGLRSCRNSAAPIVTLAQIIDGLHADPTWTADEVRQIERALRRVLAQLIVPP